MSKAAAVSKRDAALLGLGLLIGALASLTLTSSFVANEQTTRLEEVEREPGPPASTTSATPAVVDLEVGQLRHRIAELESENARLKDEASPTRIAKDSGGAASSSPAELTPDDWLTLAKTGTVKFCLPTSTDWKALGEELALGPDDAVILDSAYLRSRTRVLRALSPLCDELADAGVPSTIEPLVDCARRVVSEQRRVNPDAFRTAQVEVALMRANQLPLPSADLELNPALSVFLALTGEPELLLRDIERELGADAARRIVFRTRGCGWSGSWSPPVAE